MQVILRPNFNLVNKVFCSTTLHCALGLEFVSLDFAGHFDGGESSESERKDRQTGLRPAKERK